VFASPVKPLLHLLGLDVDAVALTATAHGEGEVELGKAGLDILLGDDVEEDRGIEDMVIEGKVVAARISNMSAHVRRDRASHPRL
jgi:hypothetical protein